MSTKTKGQLALGAGLVIALSCGVAPASAFGVAPVAAAASDVVAFAAAEGYAISQKATPSLLPGETGTATVSITNNKHEPLTGPNRGAVLKFTAPAGTTFDNATVSSAWTSVHKSTVQGTLSADKRTLTFDWAERLYGTDTVDISVTLRADAGNTRAGKVGGGLFEVVSGPALPTMSQEISYKAMSYAISQKATPKLLPGETGTATVSITNNTDPSGQGPARGAGLKFTAPAGTTFDNATVSSAWTGTYKSTVQGTLSADKRTLTVDNWNEVLNGTHTVDMTVTLRSDAGNTRAGVIGGGLFEVVSGTALPKLSQEISYQARSYAISQKATPALLPGETGTATVSITNNGDTAGNGPARGAELKFTAPAGTTFDDATVSSAWTGTYTSKAQGTLSADKRTLTVTWNERLLGTHTVDMTVRLRSDADNTRAGVIGGGLFEVVSGTALPTMSQEISYQTRSYTYAIAQGATPSLKPGETGVASIVVNNTTAAGPSSGRGASFVLTAPAGTTFADDKVRSVWLQGTYSSVITGSLSADKRTLTVTTWNEILANGQGVEMQVNLRSDAGNTRTGSIGDGLFTVTSGPALPKGETVSFGYTAEKAAAKPVVLDAPAIDTLVTDTNRPVFSGTGEPGAEITVRGVTRVIATTTVKADGTWSVPAGFELANGAYAGTVTQSTDGSMTNFRFSIRFGIPVTLAAPAQDATLQPGKPVFSGKGQPGATVVVKGQFGTPLGETTVDADGNWTVESLVSLGAANYAGTAVQTSKSDTTSASFRFTVVKNETVVTPVVLTSPAMGAEVEAGKPVFTGTGHPGATVMVQGAFGTVLGTAVVDDKGTWTVESTVTLVAGSYSGSAKQTVEGQQSSSPFAFTAK